MFSRRDVWTLGTMANPWSPILDGYAKAVAVMQSRPATDPTSWSYQSAMHGTYATPAQPNWNQCQHATWYFVSWHRMYLYYFERIIRAAVIGAGGPNDWALPYWNYENPPPANSIPPAFRVPTLPGGRPNALYVTQRAPGVNNGASLPPQAVSSAAAMAATHFAPPSGAVGFGGTVTPPAHFGPTYGLLERRPHNNVHSLVGGAGSGGTCASGWMGDPNCAAMDPIFWPHHANIDRLWSKWIQLGGGRANPTNAQWLNTQFTFYDENRNQQSMSGSQVLDTVTQLNYNYV